MGFGLSTCYRVSVYRTYYILLSTMQITREMSSDFVLACLDIIWIYINIIIITSLFTPNGSLTWIQTYTNELMVW